MSAGPQAPGAVATSLWLAIFGGVLLWSAIGPHDRATWWLEVLPALLAPVVIGFTWRRFPLTSLALWLILAHALVLMIGGHYTYARVPAFDWLRDAFELSRNHYDRVGHVFQGFVPAIVAREVLLRTSPLAATEVGRRRWVPFVVICFCLAFSAFYEMLEWWVAVLSDSGAEAFLATQGDVWDTQTDMFLCLVGALLALATLSRLHDAQLGGNGD
ncbi:MAG: DUF2238 domain-containing protein [Pseudomonadales bacterium]|nr:DUF2238 domain-containing protein [Pseudomonadales bacterium]